VKKIELQPAIYKFLEKPNNFFGDTLKNELNNISYTELVEIIGLPNSTKKSGDNKVNFQWYVEYKDCTFCIYDYKCKDLDYTLQENRNWYLSSKEIGSKIKSRELIEYIDYIVNIHRELKYFNIYLEK
jgi:hypothetical protein